MIEVAVLLFIILTSLILGLSIYRNNPHSATSKTFILSAFAIIFWSVIMYQSVHQTDPVMTLFYIRLSMLAGTIMALSFLFLAIVFPEPEMPLSRKWIAVLIFMGLITSVIAMSPYMFTELKIEGTNIEPQAGPGIIAFMITSLGSNIATFVVLLVKYFKSRGKLRGQLAFIVIGTLFMFLLLIAGNFIAVIVYKTSSFQYLGPLFTLVFLISVAYAILKHNLLDIRSVVARTVSYSLLLLVIIGLEVAIVTIGVTFLPTGINRVVVAASGSILIVIGYDYLRLTVSRITENVFFQGRYDTEEVLEKLTHIMATTIDIRVLSQKMLQILVENMRLTQGAFVLVSQNHTVSNVEEVNWLESTKLRLASLEQLIHGGKSRYVFEELEEGAIKEIFRNLGIAVAMPLTIKANEIGILLLGPKSSGEVYAERDLELLTIFAPEAAVALNNARSYQEIQLFSKTLEMRVEDRTEALKESQKKELAKAKELLRIKDEFVFIATHDLATPVTAIAGFSELIKMSKKPVPQDIKNDLAAIDEATARLRALVNDLLEVARGESGTIRVELKPINVNEAVAKAITLLEQKAKKRKITLTSQMDAQFPMIMADEDKLNEVIENLIGNAVKYNIDGGKVTITSQREDDILAIKIADTGIGIPEEEQSKVFTKFFRSDSDAARQQTGTGLGLFVVKMLVDKMKGTISFVSKVKVGTTFRLGFRLANTKNSSA